VRIPPQILLDGVARALHEQVLPHVDARTARGQLWAAIDVLRNLAGRVEPAAGPLEAEARSLADAFAAIAARLREGGAAALAERVAAAVAAAPAGPPAARAEALRAELVALFEPLAALGPPLADATRALAGAHLAAQAVRDLAALQGSLLEEISRG
jgi:GGDEF domain-containing protein